MKHMESPAKAKRKQARKLQYVPPIWPLLAIIAVVIVVSVLVSH